MFLIFVIFIIKSNNIKYRFKKKKDYFKKLYKLEIYFI